MGTQGPLLLKPRLDTKIWGGTRLAQFGFDATADDPIGEAVITAPEATTQDGQRLGDNVAGTPEQTLGSRGLAATGGRPFFPLLAKLIDAKNDLSIQVHPDDHYAAKISDGQSLGKTEAWWVIAARPGSSLYLGLRDGASHADLAATSRSGTGCGHLMRRVPAQPNTLVFLPAGTIHALGAGVMVYEIQQPSAITYRLDDWNRRDSSGQTRDLHIEDGLAVADVSSRPDPLPPIEFPTAHGRRQRLVSCPYFALERIALVAGDEVVVSAPDSPQIITVLHGAVHVTADDRGIGVPLGQTAALLADASATTVRATAPAVVLRAWVPKSYERCTR